MKKAKDMSKLHESKESLMEENRETEMEERGYEETESGKMIKPKKAFMGLAVEAAKNPVSLLGLAAKNKMGLIGGAKELKDKYFAKGGMTKSQKKIKKVMREFKAGKLHSGKKGPVVKNPKQAIAIALSEAGKSKKMAMGGLSGKQSKLDVNKDGKISKEDFKMLRTKNKRGGGMAERGMGQAFSQGGAVRGTGAAIRGTRPAKLY